MSEPVVDRELKSLIEDFDHHSPEYVRRYRDVFEYVHALPGQALRAKRYNGFWILTGYHALQEMQRDQGTFSNKQMTIPDSTAPYFIPANEDPPDHIEYRRVIARSFAPAAISQRLKRIQEINDSLFAAVAGKDEFDVVLDIAQPLTGRLTMEILGLDPEAFNEYAEPIHNATFDHGTYEERIQGFLGLLARVKQDVAEKRRNPTGLIGDLTQTDFRGRKFTDAEIEAMVLNLLTGGLGTTQGFVGSVAVYLARNPAQRQLLIDEPKLLDTTGLDELLRYLAPVQTMAKRATRDYEIDGIHIKQGEMVLLAYGGANLDAQVFENPLQVNLRRQINPIMTFGNGPHRCLGSHMAKAISRAALHKLLEVVPNYRLIEERIEAAHSIAHIMGYRSVPVRRH